LEPIRGLDTTFAKSDKGEPQGVDLLSANPDILYPSIINFRLLAPSRIDGLNVRKMHAREKTASWEWQTCEIAPAKTYATSHLSPHHWQRKGGLSIVTLLGAAQTGQLG